MSSHVIEGDTIRWVVGWDKKYGSFFLTKVDKSLSDDENPVIALGIRYREIPEADQLFILADMAGLTLPPELQLQLYQDKEQEKEYFVLYYPGEFVQGFETDSLGHAETLKDSLARARPDQELEIRQLRRPTVRNRGRIQ